MVNASDVSEDEEEDEEEEDDDDEEEEVEEEKEEGVEEPPAEEKESKDGNEASDSVTEKTMISPHEIAAQRRQLATVVSMTKILTDEDFKKIETAQIRKEVTSAKRKRIAEPDSTK